MIYINQRAELHTDAPYGLLAKILLWVSGAALFVPVNSVLLLQVISALLLMAMLALQAYKVDGVGLVFFLFAGGVVPALGLMLSVMQFGWQGPSAYFYIVRPALLSGVLLVAFCWAREISERNLRRFLQIVVTGTMLIHAAYLLGFSSLAIAYKDPGAVSIGHEFRLSGPFLYPSDLAIFLITGLLALTSNAGSGARPTNAGQGWLLVLVVLVLLTQSKLGIIGLMIVALARLREAPMWSGLLLLVVIIGAAIYFEELKSLFSYSIRLFTEIDFYVTQSKRAIEALYLLENWRDLLIFGAPRFEVVAGLDTFESSAISLLVRFGIILGGSTLLYFFVLLIQKGASAPLLSFLLLSMLIAAPFDRPKLLIGLIPLIALALKPAHLRRS